MRAYLVAVRWLLLLEQFSNFACAAYTLDTGVGATAEVRFGNVYAAQLVVSAPEFWSFIGAGWPAGFAEGRPWLRVRRMVTSSIFMPWSSRPSTATLMAGVPDFHTCDNRHDVRFVEQVAGQVGVEDDAGDVVQWAVCASSG